MWHQQVATSNLKQIDFCNQCGTHTPRHCTVPHCLIGPNDEIHETLVDAVLGVAFKYVKTEKVEIEAMRGTETFS